MRGRIYGITVFVILISLMLSGCSKGPVVLNASKQITPGKNIKQQEISFSKQDYFYSKDTQVQIKTMKPAKIYYTVDGTDPDEKQTLYKDAIKLIANDDTQANVIKAKAYYEDGTKSDTIVHTYFVGKNIKNRFDTLVFSVTTDPYNLYDFTYGIFVEGKLRNDYLVNHPGKVNPDAPANYNIRGKKGERKVYLEIFQPDGTKVIGQAAGIRTYGGWSRARTQKSIKIFARKEYDAENNKLRYAFFPYRTDFSGDSIDSYKQLVLRNCGNDNGFAFIRDELYQTLAAQAGYPDYEAVRPAALFINGEYRGFYWMHEVYCDQYFKDHYGKYDGNFKILEGGELYKNEDADADNKDAIQEYDKMYSNYSNKNLTRNSNYKKLCDAVDVDNYLSYYALNIYLGNEDWPHNNYKTYRYYAAGGETYKKAPFDGKWRYLLHDMDFTTGIYGRDADSDNISYYIGEKGEIMESCPLFGQLMQRKDCKEIFIKKTLDLINGAFAEKNLSRVLDAMNSSRQNELENTYGKGLLENWVSYKQLPGRIQVIKDYATLRARHILTKYQQYFGLGDIYSLTVKLPQGSKVKINSYTAASYFTGSYYTNYNTTLTAVLPEGKKVDYWLVNGEKIKNTKLIITKRMINEDKVNVQLVVN